MGENNERVKTKTPIEKGKKWGVRESVEKKKNHLT
jgi:hypothetical protein